MPNHRVPTAVKAARGTLQPCRTNPNEPTPEAVVSIEPALPLEGLALEKFHELVDDVASLGVLHRQHRHKLTAAAVAYARAWEADQAGDGGMFTKLMTEFRQLVSGYGLDPATMTKVGAAPRATKTEREKLEEEFFGPN